VAGIFRNHKLCVLRSGARLNASMHHLRVGAFSLNLLQYGADVEVQAEGMSDFFLVEIPLSGVAKLCLGRDEMVAGPDNYSVISPLPALRKRWQADCEQLIVRIERAAFEQSLRELMGRELRDPLQFRLDMPSGSEAGRSWSQAVRFVCESLARNADMQKFPLVMSNLQQALMFNLLLNQPHNYSEALRAGSVNVAPGFLRRLTEQLDRRLSEPLSLPQMAKMAGVSVSTLYSAFESAHGTTPMAYVKTQRLEAVRRELLALAGEQVSVTDIALRWGFSHLGHFSRSYKLRFGELPSQTLGAK
jgi:AraC-like DNA-binding protein